MTKTLALSAMVAPPEMPFCPLGSLTKASGKSAEFLVRVLWPKEVPYHFNSKNDGKKVEKVMFSCILVGEDTKHYCEARIKGSAAEVATALKKYARGTAWKLSKVGLDGHQQPEYMHTSVKVVVDLKRTQATAVLAGTKEETSLARAPVPEITITQVSGIKSKRHFDLMGIVREVSDTRTPVGHPPVADVHLVDGSTTNRQKTAEVVVAVWGLDNIALCQKHVSEPLLFLNVAAKYSGELQLNLWSGSMIVAEHPSEKMKALKATANEEGFAADREQLTSQHISSYDPDNVEELKGEVLITSCACLEVGSNDPEASLPQLLQVNGMRLEEPEVGDSVVIGTGERIFFSARARDFSGSVLVGVSQAAALALSGLASKEEFEKRHADGQLAFPAFANCRIRRRTREVAGAEESAGKTFVNTIVVAAHPLSFQIDQAPNTSYNTILEILKQCPESHEAMLAVRLSEVHGCPFYGLRVEYKSSGDAGGAPQPTRNCKVAVAIVRTTQKSKCTTLKDGFLVATSGVRDALEDDDDAQSVEVRGYCSIDNLLDFRMDPQLKEKERICVLLITSATGDALTVHSVTHIEPSAVSEARYFMRKMRTLGMRAEHVESERRKRISEWGTPPTSAKKCRTLELQPTGGSLPDC